MILDEAHIYDGVFGANVHYFLKRTYLAREILGKDRPGLFLASATLFRTAGCYAFQIDGTSFSKIIVVHVRR